MKDFYKLLIFWDVLFIVILVSSLFIDYQNYFNSIFQFFCWYFLFLRITYQIVKPK